MQTTQWWAANGTDVQFSFEHGLGVTPNFIMGSPLNQDSIGTDGNRNPIANYWFTADDTCVYVNYPATQPPNASPNEDPNIYFSFKVEVITSFADGRPNDQCTE